MACEWCLVCIDIFLALASGAASRSCGMVFATRRGLRLSTGMHVHPASKAFFCTPKAFFCTALDRHLTSSTEVPAASPYYTISLILTTLNYRLLPATGACQYVWHLPQRGPCIITHLLLSNIPHPCTCSSRLATSPERAQRLFSLAGPHLHPHPAYLITFPPIAKLMSTCISCLKENPRDIHNLNVHKR